MCYEKKTMHEFQIFFFTKEASISVCHKLSEVSLYLKYLKSFHSGQLFF